MLDPVILRIFKYLAPYSGHTVRLYMYLGEKSFQQPQAESPQVVSVFP
jgi:hypothetical protein|eukprot:COSAG01_NODE_325_length_18790_cov_64.371101_11_plen_48_part_00